MGKHMTQAELQELLCECGAPALMVHLVDSGCGQEVFRSCLRLVCELVSVCEPVYCEADV